MAKNRDQRGNEKTGAQNLPGGKTAPVEDVQEEGLGDVSETDIARAELERSLGKEATDVLYTQAEQPVANKDVQRVEMALLHLQLFEDELRKLVAHKSSVAGLMRRTAAGLKLHLDGDAQQWPPIKLLRAILVGVKTAL